MRKPRLAWIIALLALLGLLAIFYPRGGADGGREGSNAMGDRHRRAATMTGVESRRERDAARGASRRREVMPPHQVGDLPRFILPLAEGREVTLKAAVRILMEAYKEACYRSRTEPLELEFNLPDDDSARISFSIEGGNFQAVLAHLAALAGYTVTTDGLLVSFEPVPAGTELSAATFRVKPGLHEALAGQLQRLGLPADGSLAGMAAAAGLVNPDRSLTLSPNGILQTALTPGEALKVETWLAGLSAPTQIKASIQLVHSDKPLEIDPHRATPEEVREWLGTLTAQPGVTVVRAPSVTMRAGQESTVEMLNGTPADWTGSRITIEAEPGGLAILARDTTEYRPDDRSAPPLRGTSQVVAGDGVAQVALVGSRDGDWLYRVLTFDLIDATGRPLRDQVGGYPVGAAVPGKEGYILSPYNNKIIDVRGIPAGALVQDPTYPPEERKYFRVP